MHPLPSLIRPQTFLLLLTLSLTGPLTRSFAAESILGFAPSRSARQLSLEQRYDAQLDPRDQDEWLKHMASAPNHLGSPHDKENAEFILSKFREFGWDAQIETFHVMFPTPIKQKLEMVEPKRFTAKLREPSVKGDATSRQSKGVLPPFHAYGGDGDVTAELVYVNQGMPDDYKELERRGISVKGRIVIARYGGGWRGIKPKLAYEHGAVGCLIYSDPKDDGYAVGDVYPEGAWRPRDGVQRGSVADMPVYPGDPLTPGNGATKDAKRLTMAEAKTILKIPVMPISYADAQPLLEALGGPVVPVNWRGALPITYHYGPGPAKVHLVSVSKWQLTPLYNVIAKIKGSELPDQWVMRGNHHDGWVFGAWDPLSANVAMLAEAKAIGALLKQGWRPRRTLVYASWDGEEPGLLGSTEWCEEHADELRQKLVLYVNSDTNGRGFLRAGGTHSMQAFINEVADVVRDPQTGVSARQRLRARMLIQGTQGGDADDRQTAQRLLAGGNLPLYALGSGSDYSPFLQHLGIASVDLRYGGEDEDQGIYHSVYDSYDHYVRFGDPGFVYGVTLAQTIGRVILRTSESDVLPMRFTELAETIEDYAGELHAMVRNMQAGASTQRKLVDENAFALASDPNDKIVPPEREGDVPKLDFTAMDRAVERLKKSAAKFDETSAKATNGNEPTAKQLASKANALLQRFEQTLTHADGLPGRPWFRHMIYAPGLHTGYGVKTIPGVREAIEERQWETARDYVKIVAGVLNKCSDQLDQATAALKSN